MKGVARLATHADDKNLSCAMQGLDEDLQQRLLQLLAPSPEEEVARGGEVACAENGSEVGEAWAGHAGESHAVSDQARASRTEVGQVGASQADMGQVDVSRIRERVQRKLDVQLGVQLEGKVRRGLHRRWRREMVGVIGGLGVAGVIGALTLVSPFSGSSAHNGNLPQATAIGKIPATSSSHNGSLSFVPGLGMVQSSRGGAPVYILQAPVGSTLSGSPVQVTGLMVTSNEMMVSLVGLSQEPLSGDYLPKVVFKTKAGQNIVLTSSLGVGDGVTGRYQFQWAKEFYALGHFHVTSPPSGTLLIGTRTPTRIPVRLVLAKSVQNMDQLGPTKTVQGITMTAVATRSGRDAVLTVIPQYQGNFHIWNSVPMSAAGKLGIDISDSLHHHYAPKQLLTLGPNSQISFQPRQGVTRYLVTVPNADATYSGTAGVTLPIPAAKSAIVDKTITLAGFPVTFTKVERLDGASSQGASGSAITLRVFLNMHANPTAPRELVSFQMHSSWSYRIDSKTGAIDWMDIPVQPHQSLVTLNLSQPEVYIRGPWTFPITLPSVHGQSPTKSAKQFG